MRGQARTFFEYFSIIFFFSAKFYTFYLKQYVLKWKFSQLFDKKMFQLLTSNGFLAMTRKISKGIKISVFLLSISHNILYLTNLLTYFHGSRIKFSHLAKKKTTPNLAL